MVTNIEKLFLIVACPSTNVSGHHPVESCPSTNVGGHHSVVACPSTNVGGHHPIVACPPTYVSGHTSIEPCPSTNVGGHAAIFLHFSSLFHLFPFFRSIKKGETEGAAPYDAAPSVYANSARRDKTTLLISPQPSRSSHPS